VIRFLPLKKVEGKVFRMAEHTAYHYPHAELWDSHNVGRIPSLAMSMIAVAKKPA
jgi:hypothetical protein